MDSKSYNFTPTRGTGTWRTQDSTLLVHRSTDEATLENQSDGSSKCQTAT